jgi:hypothetical protein
MIVLKVVIIIIAWILGFIPSRKYRQISLALTLIVTITVLFVDNNHMKELSNRVTSLLKSYEPIEKTASEHYPQLPKDEAIKKYLGDIDKIKADNKKLNSELAIQTKLSEEMAYQEYALYGATGHKKGVQSLNGNLINPTPLMDWNKDFVSRSDGKIICNCSPESIPICRSVIKKFPQYPFSYYFLSLCLKDKGDSSWRGYAKKAETIFIKTTKMQNHHNDHDLILIEIKKLLARTS